MLSKTIEGWEIYNKKSSNVINCRNNTIYFFLKYLYILIGRIRKNIFTIDTGRMRIKSSGQCGFKPKAAI